MIYFFTCKLSLKSSLDTQFDLHSFVTIQPRISKCVCHFFRLSQPNQWFPAHKDRTAPHQCTPSCGICLDSCPGQGRRVHVFSGHPHRYFWICTVIYQWDLTNVRDTRGQSLIYHIHHFRSFLQFEWLKYLNDFRY